RRARCAPLRLGGPAQPRALGDQGKPHCGSKPILGRSSRTRTIRRSAQPNGSLRPFASGSPEVFDTAPPLRIRKPRLLLALRRSRVCHRRAPFFARQDCSAAAGQPQQPYLSSAFLETRRLWRRLVLLRGGVSLLQPMRSIVFLGAWILPC